MVKELDRSNTGPLECKTAGSNESAKMSPTKVVDLAYSHHGDIIAEALGADIGKGLSDEEATLRLKRNGLNALSQETRLAWWRVFIRQFSSIVVWLLLVAAAVAWFTNGVPEAIAILTVLILNAGIGFAIEWRAGQALNALRRETPTFARVRRTGREKVVNATELVVGDIIALTAGDRVPADARLLEAANLRTDESTLTGESTSAEKSIESVSFSSILAERRSMLYLGTIIVAGRALAIVTTTGSYTEMGRIGQLLAKTESEKTPLERRLASLGRILVYLVLGIAAVIMLAGLFRGDPLWLMLEISISLAVAAVPEALPAMTTLILALGVLRMARNRAIVRKLAAVEALGSTTVICTDKTGTLTENRMTVREYHVASGRHFETHADVTKTDPVLKRLLRVSVLCNEAAFDPKDPEKKAVGDPTETALLSSANELGFDTSAERLAFTTVREEPFEAASRRMVTIVHDKYSGPYLALMKGAPAVVLKTCTQYAGEGNQSLALDDAMRDRFLATNDEMAHAALRVLAFADKDMGIQENCPKKGAYSDGFTFLGFVGMTDPPRSGVATAIRQAYEAGIRVVMLTGDQVNTAQAIARELNLSHDGDIFALHSRELVDGDDRYLADAIRRAHVFARVSPEDKLRIVEALQKEGEIVAVTGDGINDAPALKRSNIGIAMGERGTEVAKEAADVVLTDDNFSTIVKAIEGGRTIYANIIKFVHFMFAANLAEVLVIFVSILAGFALPLLPLQILWVNLVTDVFPAFALAVEPASAEMMKRRPRPPEESLLSRRFLILIAWQGIMLAGITLLAYAWALHEYGEGTHARTITLLALVGVQIGHLFNCRSRTRSAFEGFFRNFFIFAAVAVMVLLQALALYLSPIAGILDLVPPNWNDILLTLGCILTPVLIVELTKKLGRMRKIT